MTDTPTAAGSHPTVLVTGANGLVGASTCRLLLDRGWAVRALVRRAGAAPAGADELVGEITDAEVAAAAVSGVEAVVSTVHPMGSDEATQHEVGVTATVELARAARDAGARRFVHVSTAAVYDRPPEAGDADETSPLVGDAVGGYPVAKRDADAAIAEVDGLTRVLVRPPAILGSASSSVWNTRRPAAARDDGVPSSTPKATFAWVHVEDLAGFLADLAEGRIRPAPDDPDAGPVADGCTAVNVAGEPAVERDYWSTVTGALGLEPEWSTEPAWTGRYLADRAAAWGWRPRVDLATALAELDRDVRDLRDAGRT